MTCRKEINAHLVISDSIKLVNKEHWDSISADRNLYLSRPYLEGLEEGMENGMEFRYVIYYCEKYTPIGIAYFQSVLLEDKGSPYRDRVQRLGERIGSRAMKEMKARILVNGNVFQCGENGYLFDERLSREEILEMLSETLERLKGDEEMAQRPTFLMFKEVRKGSIEPTSEILKKKGYHHLHMDLNMCLHVDQGWDGLDGYLQALTSKARTRVKRIMKLSKDLEIESLDTEAIRKELARIDELFEYILDGSEFQFGRLDMAVYAEWKERLGDDFIFRAYRIDGRMVGFSTAFRHDGFMEAQYVGYDPELNRSHSIYQRMLIQYLQDAMEKGVLNLNLGRTAEQAKSSLGAVPVDMMLYVKHRNMIANKLIRPILSSVHPSEFEQRSPFKQAVHN